MSQATSTRGVWLGHREPVRAQDALRKVVAGLTRARRLQHLVDYGFGGVLIGFGLAAVAVLVARLVSSPYSSWRLAGAAVCIAGAVALAVGWWRRPHALEVVIRADLNLKLAQRLSTAWEFMTVHGNSALAERLAVQAVKGRLPPSPSLVFPLRVNRWGRLLPLAATALLLVSLLDWDRTQPTMPPQIDERVVSEGRRLGEFARAMQARATRNELPRSARQASRLESLGARMEGGALSREQTLDQLRNMGRSLDEESLQTLADANRAGIQRPLEDAGGRPPTAGSTAIPERAKGTLHNGDTVTLSKDRSDDRVRSGIPRRELEEAMRRQQAAREEQRRQMLENLAADERARKEHEELRRAREQVRRARENLGDALAGAGSGQGSANDVNESKGHDAPEDTSADRRRDARKAGSAPRYGLRGDSGSADDPQQPALQPESGRSGPILKPQVQMREGDVFVSEGSVLPRSTRPKVENVEMKEEFSTQVEEVLSREHYPAHYKEFIRRYFLSLSQGPAPSKREAHRE